MEIHYSNFVTTFYKFIGDINRYVPTNGTKKSFEEFHKFDMAKLIFRTFHLLNDNITNINNKNELLFEKPFILLPDVDISSIWPNLIKGQKDKTWTYLNILQIESELLMNHTTQSQSITEQQDITLSQTEVNDDQSLAMVHIDAETTSTTEPVPEEFNPYVGIGCTNNTLYGVNEMFSALPTEDENQSCGPGIETIAKMIGLNKLVNFEELSEQLKNMKKEDIDNATNGIKGLLGDNIDEKTSALFKTMLTDISEEMKSTELGKGDPFKNLMNIAETVAGKMKPTIEKDNIDISQLINSTQVFANQCKDKDGKPIFDGKMNPFSLLSQFVGNSAQGDLNQEQCMAQCNAMLNNMGMNGTNLESMMSQMMGTQTIRPPNNQMHRNNNAKRGGKRKKKN